MKSLISLVKAASLVFSQKDWGSVDAGQQRNVLLRRLLGGGEQGGLQLDGQQNGLQQTLFNKWEIASNEAMLKCGIDTKSLSFFDKGNLSLDLALFKQYALLFPDTCSEADEQTFRDAFETFQTCSSFDVEEVLETFGDAVIGSAMECALSMAPIFQNITDMTELNGVLTPDKCQESLLGKNPFGDMIRNTILYPDKVLPCFAAFSESIPQCTVEQWPVPLVGPVLKMATCYIRESTHFLTQLSEDNLGSLDACLPDIDEDEYPMDDTRGLNCSSCQNLMGTEALIPCPFSDLSKRLAQSHGLDEVIPRFEAYAKQCLPEQWHGWSYETGDYYNPARHPKPEGAGSVVPPASTAASDSAVTSTTKDAVTNENNGMKSGFGVGIAVGFAMGLVSSLALIFTAACCQNKQRQNSREKSLDDTDNSDDGSYNVEVDDLFDDDDMHDVNLRLT